jgi:beta-glucosidase
LLKRSISCLSCSSLLLVFIVLAYAVICNPHKVGAQSASAASHALANAQIDQRVDALLRQMTLEEKVGQLVQYSAGQPTGPGTGRSDYHTMIAKGAVGALFNVTNAKDVNAFQRTAVEKSRLHIPLIFGLDVIHGFRTEFPIPLGMAATWNPDLVEKSARVAAQESSAAGVRWTFSPMVDIARDARWGRMAEGAGEDPFLGSQLAIAYVKGYQGSQLGAGDSIAACAKHYVGYGAAEAGRDYNSTEISEHTLRQYYLPPFHAAVEAGSLSIMSAFNALNGIPASANPFTLKQILRKEWGFQGVVDSDWTSLGELKAHGMANDDATAALKAFLGGVDIDMESNLYHEHLAQLVRAGKVTQAELDESVRRVLRMKFVLGLFDHPYADETRESQAMLRPTSVELARTAAEQSFVLLKNSPDANGAPLLPLQQNVRNIALIGPAADDVGNMLGSWAGQSRAEDVVSLRRALGDRIGEDHLFQLKGTGYLGGSDSDIQAAVEAVRKADLAILALGENAPEMTGEAASRAHLDLPGRQQELLERVVATGKPVVLILFSGRPLTLPWAFEHVPAILEAWFPGVQAGPALVRTLFGEANPNGRLPVSWPRSVGQEPLYYNALSTGRPAADTDLTRPPSNSLEKFVSRYIDEQNSPQFPFGYGLSYTNFRYGATAMNTGQLKTSILQTALRDHAGDSRPVLTASAEVTNVGSRSGEETLQLYIRLRGTTVAQPVRALKGFQRISLSAGESKKVTFAISPDALALWDDQNKFAIEACEVTVWIAPDAAHGTPASLTIVP